MVIVGEPGSILIPELPRARSGAERLRGLRLLHTHLSPDGLSQEDLMDMLFLRLDAVAVLTVSPSGDLYVAATAYGGILEICPIGEQGIGNPSYRYFYEPHVRQEGHVYTPTPETVYGFCHLSATDRFIYATAHGQKNPTAMPTTIWKFSLSGEPVAAYHCGDTSIESFTVDEERQEIYTVAYGENGEHLLGRISMNTD